MRTVLPEQITTVEEAKQFLSDLYYNKEYFHPEDDAHRVVWSMCKAPTPEECDMLNELMEDIYNLKGNDGRHIDLLFDPCEYLLILDNH